MEIQHFSHGHPLTLYMMNGSDSRDTWCFACGKNNFDLMYICKTCENFRLHKTCAGLPTKIERHPFHPAHTLYIMFNGPRYACCGCGKKHEKLLYYCEGCNFTLNPECTLNPMTKYDILGEGRIKHVMHDHPLTFSGGNDIIGMEQGKKCLGCDKQCYSNETFYSCNICGAFSLHTSCLESLPRAITHPSHPEHPMMLRVKDQWFDRPCVKCGRTDNVLTYRCSMCKVEMDPGCALKQTKNKSESQNNPNKTQTLRSIQATEILTCAELPTKIERHPFHPSHALNIVFNGQRYACCGCGKKHEKLLYYCEGCNFTLNPECALNPTTKYDILGEGRIKHVMHDHPLTFSGNDIMGVEQGKKCQACDKLCSSNETFYSCNVCGAFSLHTSCMESLPRVITHPSHPEHPMMLRAKDEWFDRPCVKCGRTDNVLTYRCSMCKVEMDPGCALKQTKYKSESQNNPNKTETLRSIPPTDIVKNFFGRKK